jgi:hypothetical protein
MSKDYYKKEIEGDVKGLFEIIDALEKRNASLQSEFGKIQELEKLEVYNINHDVKRGLEYYRLDFQADMERAKRNEVRVEANRALLQKVYQLLIDMGVPTKEWIFASSRSHQKKYQNAPWIADLRRLFPLSCTTARQVEDAWENFKKKVAEAEKKEREVAEYAKRQAEAEQKERTGIALAIKYAIELGLENPEQYTPNTLVTVLRDNDKYLNLAMAMEQTRGNWSEGFWRVDTALDEFKIETDMDKIIYAEISDLVNGDERDGRIFRDCAHNYGMIYQLVNPKIASIYSELSKYATDY